MARKLSLKMRTFCLAYAGEANGNGTEAARIAGYKGKPHTLEQVAHENLRKPEIVAEIAQLRLRSEQKLEKRIMTAAEVKAELSEIALVPWNELVEIRLSESGDVIHASIKLTDKIKSLELMGKVHALFPTKIEISTKDADSLTDAAARAHGLPVPGETFGGAPLHTDDPK